MKPTTSTLIRLRVQYGTYENELYFDVDQMRELYPNLRFPPDKIRQVVMGGITRDGIRQQDILELSEFDKNMIKLYNFGKK